MLFMLAKEMGGGGGTASFKEVLKMILIPVGGLVGVWALYIGWKLATAEDDRARSQAKDRLIKAAISAALIIGLAAAL